MVLPVVGVALIATGVAVVTAPVVVPALLGAVGFGASGVVGGSIAAAVQSSVYGAFTTGIFSVLQSAGATAVVAAPAIGQAVVGAAGVVAGVAAMAL